MKNLTAKHCRYPMAIQPIDLQALFSQLDKVGKTQAVAREGQQIQESIQQIQNQQKLEQNIQAVNQAQNMGEEAETIKDDNRRGAHDNNNAKEKRTAEADSQDDRERFLIHDPALGQNIDISG